MNRKHSYRPQSSTEADIPAAARTFQRRAIASASETPLEKVPEHQIAFSPGDRFAANFCHIPTQVAQGPTVLQRLIRVSDKERFTINWDEIDIPQALNIAEAVEQGEYEYESGEEDKIVKILQNDSSESAEEPTVLQPPIWVSDPKHFTINWDEIDELQAMAIEEAVEQGEYEYKPGEKRKIEEILEDDDSEYDPNEDLNPDMMDMMDVLHPKFKQKVNERKGRKLPGKSVQGDLLEHNVSTFTADIEMGEFAANSAAMNIPGIDHVIDSSEGVFMQDKLHLSEHTAHTGTYRAHFANRNKMAEKLLEAMAKDGERGEKIRGMFETVLAKDAWINKDVLRKISLAVKAHREAVNKAIDDDKAKSIPSISDDETLISTVASNIVFAVPADIWEALYQQSEAKQIPPEEMQAYFRLDLTTSEFRAAFSRFSDVAAPWNETKPNKEEEEYSPM